MEVKKTLIKIKTSFFSIFTHNKMVMMPNENDLSMKWSYW